MKKVLFITNRNVLTTSGELRLIKNRSESLYEEYGVITDFIVFGASKRIRSNKREQIKAGGSTSIIPFSLFNILSFVLGIGKVNQIIIQSIKNNKYDAVVLSGIGMVCAINRVKKLGVPVYVDLHGALEDALVISSSKGFLGKIKYNLLFQIDKFACEYCMPNASGCFAVTEALKIYAIDRFKLPSNVSFHIVPCATNKTTPLLDRELYRNEYRKKYDISDDEVVFVYSGGIAPWQCVEETISLYKKVADNLKRPSRMLLFSHMTDYFNTIIGDDKRFIVDSHRPETLKAALCAADYAFMLRKDCPTNNVAFPNKFLEYVECRLCIITTPYVNEIYNQVIHYKLGIVINDLDDYATILENTKSTKGYSESIAQDVLTHNSFKRCLHSFVKEIDYHEEIHAY